MKQRILIVEDDEDLQVLYEVMLEDLDCQIIRAYDGGEAFAKLEESVPDLIILDILLDEVMGDAFFKKVKQQSRYKDLPIVIASVLPSESCQKLLETDPGTVFLQKPFHRTRLLEVVKRGLQSRL